MNNMLQFHCLKNVYSLSRSRLACPPPWVACPLLSRHVRRGPAAPAPARCLSKYNPEVKPPSKVKMGILKRYMGWLEHMEAGLGRRYPKAYKIYMLFKIGIKDFFQDFKMFYSVSIDHLKNRPLQEFSRAELQNYQQFPRELLRVGPSVVLLNIPVTDMLLPILLYFFPRHLLCRHFWTPEQRIQFGQYYLRQRMTHFRSVLKYLQRHAKHIHDDGQRQTFLRVIHQLQQGHQVGVADIMELKPVFVDRPFGLEYLARMHKIETYHLAKCLNLSTRPTRLPRDANLLHHIDLATHREGIKTLSFETLQQMCFQRGLDGTNASRETLELYISDWLAVSTRIDNSSLSLLLHCPVFLGLTHPENSNLQKAKTKGR